MSTLSTVNNISCLLATGFICLTVTFIPQLVVIQVKGLRIGWFDQGRGYRHWE